MKKCLSLLLFLSFIHFGFSQADTAKPVYLRFPTIPQFTIYKASDSTTFTRENLQKKKTTVFILFSPDCEHCQHETEELKKNIEKFNNTQIVMIGFLPHNMITDFYRDYKIADYPQITMGRDTKFFFPVFFNIKSLPAIYVYDKKGRFKKAFEGSVGIDKIAEAL